MRRGSTEESAAVRARWLAELADALLLAQELAWRFEQAAGGSPEAMDLFARLETVRGEVRALQLRNVPARNDDHGPKWTNKSPWGSPADEGDA